MNADLIRAQGVISELKVKTGQVEELLADKAKLEAELANEKKSASEKLALLQDAEARLKSEFENLANRLLEDKGKALTEQQRDQLLSLLQPFKEQIESFRTRVDQVHSKDVELTTTLLQQIRSLQEASAKVSEDANNLAKALKGDSKAIGNWGELAVERIFEQSRLQMKVDNY